MFDIIFESILTL